VTKERAAGFGVTVCAREEAGIVGDRVLASAVASAAVCAAAGVTVVRGKGIVASGGGVVARVAPAMSAVVREAKCPAVRPPVRQRT
jgi:hypothetical protein